MAASILHAIRLTLFVVTISVIVELTECYVVQGPDNAVHTVGDSVIMLCASSRTDISIRWLFTCTRCVRSNRNRRLLVDGDRIISDELEPAVAVINANNGTRQYSSLRISGVDIRHEGVYTCVEGDSDTAAARITVISRSVTTADVFSSSTPSCLPVSPRDVIATVGDVIHLAASSSPYQRWYRESSYTRDNLIYNSVTLNHAKYDERYDVINGSQGRADLVIRDVRAEDAGRYVARDEEIAVEVSANVVVLERPIECHASSILTSVTIECSFNYSGSLTPTITWNNEDITNSSLVVHSTGGAVHSTLKVPVTKFLSVETAQHQWQATFPLSRCGEVVDQWTWSTSLHDVGMSASFVGDLAGTLRKFLVIVAVTAVFFIVLLTAVVCVFCCCRRRHHKMHVYPEEAKVYQALDPVTRMHVNIRPEV